jgi:hypothetical protein
LGFLNYFFTQKSLLPTVCNYRRMWYDFSNANESQIVIEHGKYGVNPQVAIPGLSLRLIFEG